MLPTFADGVMYLPVAESSENEVGPDVEAVVSGARAGGHGVRARQKFENRW